MAQDALELTGDGKVLLHLRRPWRDGTRAICFEPNEFLDQLCVLVPRPRSNLLIYHGAFSARGRGRSELGIETEEAATTPENVNHPSGADLGGRAPTVKRSADRLSLWSTAGHENRRQGVTLPATGPGSPEIVLVHALDPVVEGTAGFEGRQGPPELMREGPILGVLSPEKALHGGYPHPPRPARTA